MSDYINLNPGCWPAANLLREDPDLDLDDFAAVASALTTRYGEEAVYGHDATGVFSAPITPDSLEHDLSECRAEIARHHRDFRTVSLLVSDALADATVVLNFQAETERLRSALRTVQTVVG